MNTTTTDNVFGPQLTKQQLNVTFMVDTSGSMYGERMNQLNLGMDEAIKAAEEAALEHEVQLLMRVIEFNSTAQWIHGDTETGVEHIDWVPCVANGGTNTAAAIDLACSVMHRRILGERNFRPVLILVTDGESNSPQETFETIERLKSTLKSSTDSTKDKIIRIAIGVKDANQTELRNFASIGNIVRADGTVEENVPLVFNVDDVSLLKGLLKGITVSSIMSSIGGGCEGDNGIEPPPTIEPVADSDDWEA